ncbi:MAG: lytic transglycosylase domain-containing protein [Acidobacteriota bacterium]
MFQKKNIYIRIFWSFYIFAMFSTVIFIAKQNNEKKLEIVNLQEQVSNLEVELETDRKELKKVELLKYKEMLMNKKHPIFSKIMDVVFKKSKEYKIDPNIIMGLIQVESNFKPYAVSNRGAYGLMQVNYSVWKKELNINTEKIFDIEYNIDLGIRILRMYIDESKGDILRALHLYNNGYLYNNEAYKYKVISTVFF